MDRMTIFKESLHKCQALHLKFPQVKTIESIVHQIEYLIEIESGRLSDRSRLKDIILGIQAAREIEPLDNDLAEILYRVNEEARKM